MESVRCANCQSLQRRVDYLQVENERLRRQLDAALRAGKRQAAPFAKGQPNGQPKRPGRKQLALGCINHHTQTRQLPTGGWGWSWNGDPDRGVKRYQPGGWGFNILPYIEQSNL